MERNELLDSLDSILRAMPEVLACWEGGSVAFGAQDIYSDIDLQVLARDEATEEVQCAIESMLSTSPGIALRLEVPRPTWHGHWQAFYLFHNSSPYLMLDLVILKESVPERFLQPERHGQARILFDRGSYCQPQVLDREAHLLRMQSQKDMQITAVRMYHTLVDKEVFRKRPTDALHFYRSLLGRIIELARMKHCPDRYDFGGRYLQRDLPTELYAELERLSFVAHLSDLSEKKHQLMQLFEAVV